MIAWPNTLIEDIARRNCVIFLGSGISCNSTNADGEKPKSWRALLEYGANKHIDNNDLKDRIIRKVSEGDYLLACEMLKRGMGDESFSDYLKKEEAYEGYRSYLQGGKSSLQSSCSEREPVLQHLDLHLLEEHQIFLLQDLQSLLSSSCSVPELH